MHFILQHFKVIFHLFSYSFNFSIISIFIYVYRVSAKEAELFAKQRKTKFIPCF